MWTHSQKKLGIPTAGAEAYDYYFPSCRGRDLQKQLFRNHCVLGATWIVVVPTLCCHMGVFWSMSRAAGLIAPASCAEVTGGVARIGNVRSRLAMIAKREGMEPPPAAHVTGFVRFESFFRITAGLDIDKTGSQTLQ